MSNIEIRMIKDCDIDAALAIYRYYVENTTISFEYEAPSAEEFAHRVKEYTRKYPWLVCLADNCLIGYAYASDYRTRTAYSWDCELSVYLDKGVHGKGLGKILYEQLFELLRQQGYYNAYALIALPNGQSIRFHKGLGFLLEGTQRSCGYKMGEWIDLACYVKQLLTYSPPEKFPKTIHELDCAAIQWNLMNISRKLSKEWI